MKKVHGKKIKEMITKFEIEAAKKEIKNLEKNKNLVISEEFLPTDSEVLLEVNNIDKYIPY